MTSDDMLLGKLEQLIPIHMHKAMLEWFFLGRRGSYGDFFTALINNDFMEMCRRADLDNQRALFKYASFFYNYMPIQSVPGRNSEWTGYENSKEDYPRCWAYYQSLLSLSVQIMEA